MAVPTTQRTMNRQQCSTTQVGNTITAKPQPFVTGDLQFLQTAVPVELYSAHMYSDLKGAISPTIGILLIVNFTSFQRLAGLVVKAYASRAEDPGFDSRLKRDFSGWSHTSDLKIGTLPGAWHYRVSAGTVSILRLGEVESLICNFYLSVTARKIVFPDPSLR